MSKGIVRLILISLLVAVLFGLLFSRSIARDFRQEVSKSIGADLPAGVEVNYHGRHAYLSGQVDSEETLAGIKEKIESVENKTWSFLPATPGTAHVHTDDVKVVTPDRPFVGLTAFPGRVRLSGEVASTAHRDTLLARAAAAYPRANGNIIDDEITVKPLLAKVADPTPTFDTFPPLPTTGTNGIIAGAYLGEPWQKLDETATADALRSGLGAYPPEDRPTTLHPLVEDHFIARAEQERMAALPRGWVGLSQYGKRCLLRGSVPSESVKNEIGSAAANRYPGFEIDNQIAIAEVQPTPAGATATSIPPAKEVGYVGAAWLGQPWQSWGGEAAPEDLSKNLAGNLPEGVSTAPLVEPFVKYRNAVAKAAMESKLPRPYAGIVAYEKSIDLHGRVRDEQTRRAIVDAVSKAHPDRGVNNLIQVSDDVRLVTEFDPTLTTVPAIETPDGRHASSTWVGEPWGRIAVITRDGVESGFARHFPANSPFTTMVDPLFRAKPLPTPTPTPSPTPDPAPAPTPEKPLVVANIYFALGEGDFSSQQAKALTEVRKVLAAKPEARFEVAGHTCDLGDDNANLELSKKRAGEFRQYLLEAGLTTEQVSAKGYGETSPAAPNDSETNRRKNRRVEIRVR